MITPFPVPWDSGVEKATPLYVSVTIISCATSNSATAKTSSRISVGDAWRRLSGAPAWEHRLSEKHLEKAPSTSKTVRYFDRSRQNRRVFLDCLWMWFGTAVICAGIAVVLAVSQHRSMINGLSSWEKYTFNTLINGLLLILGIAFAAQFKQYCEMMRWRFLASSYRSLDEFDEVMGCDSWRSAIRLIYKRSKKSWYPNKSQVLAVTWVLIFSIFNVFAALLGLTYGLDPAEWTRLSPGGYPCLEWIYCAASNGAPIAVVQHYESTTDTQAEAVCPGHLTLCPITMGILPRAIRRPHFILDKILTQCAGQVSVLDLNNMSVSRAEHLTPATFC